MANVFHPKCGLSITLLNGNRTAVRNYSEFNYGVVLSSQPLVDNQLFEVKIEKKIVPWTGSIEMGVTVCDPDLIDIPACASDLRDGTWIMSGNSIVNDGLSLVDMYGRDLDTLVEGDCLGVMRTGCNKLVFFVNGESMGVAAVDIPQRLFAVVDVYGKCAQVSIVENSQRTRINCGAEAEVAADVQEEAEADADLDVDVDVDVDGVVNGDNQFLLCSPDPCLAEPAPVPERLAFHTSCGDLVKISNNGRTAERTKPLDEFNNGVVMTNRALLDGELFEIRIDQLVVKWSGSIEVGVTTHDPATLTFPATMTNMRSGTTMMSGNGILTNGGGSRREYGDFNLDKLQEGDRIGMMRKANGDLHYYINGLDQGVAASNVPPYVFGVVDLYGMTVKVTIVNRDEREEQNLITRRNVAMRDQQYLALNDIPEEDTADRLKFHPRCGFRAAVINNNRTAHRPTAFDEFNNAVVLTNRPLRPNELFQVRLDSLVVQWTGSIEIGVTTHSPLTLEFPSTMTNVRTGTWIMTGKVVMQNGTPLINEYGYNLDKLQVGDRVGVMRKDTGAVHFYVNGIDQGEAISSVPENVYGVIDLYGQVVQATIVYSDSTLDTAASDSISTCANGEMRFYHIHGRNARISNNGRTASRPHAYREYSKAIVICNRALRDNELFEVVIDKMVDRWYGSIEAGVTTIRPDELEFANTMTEIDHGTWMLSGSAVMKDGVILNNVYECDLDTLGTGTRIGMMRTSDGTLHYFLNGVNQGPAHTGLPSHVYPVIDLYGQCAQVSIFSPSEVAPASPVPQDDSGNSSPQQAQLTQPSQQTNAVPQHATCPPLPSAAQPMHLLNKICGQNVVVNGDRKRAIRYRDYNHGLVLGASLVSAGELFEVQITSVSSVWAGSLSIGLTSLNLDTARHLDLPATIADIEADTWFITGNEVRKNETVLRTNYCHSLDLLTLGDRVGVKRTSDGTMRLLVNGHDWGAAAFKLPKDVIPVVDIFGAVVSVEMTSHVKTPAITAGHLQSVAELSALSAPVRLASGESPLVSPDDQGADDYSRRSSHLLDSLENIPAENRITSEMTDSKHSDVHGETATTENSAQTGPACPPPVASLTHSHSFDLQEDTVLLELHENHGSNVTLGEGRRSAKRTSGYNQGLVLTSRPLPPGKAFQIRIGHLNSRWVSSIMLGVTAFCPERHSALPASALEFRQATWLLCADAIFRNGVKLKGKSSLNLDSICEGSVLGLTLGADGRLTTFLNGAPAMTINTDLAPNMQPCYVLVDLYGQCDEITILGCRDDMEQRACRVSTLERNVAANNIANAALLASSLESSLSLSLSISTAPQPDSLGEKADLETHEKDTSPLDQETTNLSSTSDSNCIHSNPNDIVNLTTMHHSNHNITSSTHSAPSPFYLNQGPGSQSTNNLSMDPNTGHFNVGLNLSAVFPSSGSLLSNSNSNPNLNSSSNSNHRLNIVSSSANSSSDHNYSSPYQINRLNNGTLLVGGSTPSSPLTPTYTLKSGSNCDHLQVCLRFKRLIGLPEGFFLRTPACYCAGCAGCAPHPGDCQVFPCKGEPAVRYSVPLGWCRFPLRKRSSTDVHDAWHIAFYGTRVPLLRRILDRGELVMQDNLGLSSGSQCDIKSKDDDADTATSPLMLSPSIKYACTTATKYEFTDPKSHRKLVAHAMFQVQLRPGSYKTVPTTGDQGTRSPDAYEWITKEKGATVLSALLLRIEGM